MAQRVERGRSRGGRWLRAAWIVLLVVVLAAAGWLTWQLVGTTQLAGNYASSAIADHEAACQTGGQGQSDEVLGVLSFPRLGDRSWPIMAGISDADLATGIGHYPQTAGVGEIGNMVLAGYRITHGEPFAGLLRLDAGDIVRITTCSRVVEYEIDVAPRDLTVPAGDDWILDAVPGRPGRVPTGRMITLVTSQDLLPTDDRSVAFGHVVSSSPR